MAAIRRANGHSTPNDRQNLWATGNEPVTSPVGELQSANAVYPYLGYQKSFNPKAAEPGNVKKVSCRCYSFFSLRLHQRLASTFRVAK